MKFDISEKFSMTIVIENDDVLLRVCNDNDFKIENLEWLGTPKENPEQIISEMKDAYYKWKKQ